MARIKLSQIWDGETLPSFRGSQLAERGKAAVGTGSLRLQQLSARGPAPAARAATPSRSGPLSARTSSRPSGALATPRRSQTEGLGGLGSLARPERVDSTALVPSHQNANIEPELPAYTYVKVGVNPDAPLRPGHPLWVALQGGDGKWQQRQAKKVWEQQLVDHEDGIRQRREEDERRRRLQAELAARRKREADEQLRRRREEAEREARLKREQEEAARRQQEEAERRRKQEEERQRRMWQPRTCGACKGTKRCALCDGRGCSLAYHLSGAVDSDAVPPSARRGLRDRPHGLLRNGCPQCGGAGEELVGTFSEGTGMCHGCGGAGQVAPPPGGWPDA